MKEDNNTKSKLNKKRIFVYTVFIFVLLYILYAVYLLAGQPVDKVTVEYGTLYQEETVVGYVVRDETVVRGDNYKNGMEQIKTEGEKAAKGSSIYRYYSKNEEEIKKQISDLDIQIQDVLKGQNDLFSSDVKLLENQLDDKIDLLCKTMDMSKISEYSKQINDLVTKKAKAAGTTSAAGNHLKQLYDQRTKLENQLNSGAEYIKAPISGIVSYKVDGLEETLTPNNFSTLNKKYLEGLNLKTAQLIATNDECGKIIDSSKCYLVTISNSKDSNNAQVGDKVQVRLSNDKLVDAKIAYISKEDENDVLIALEIEEQIKELANYRKISFELIWWSSNGLKVPTHAVVEENGLNYVVRNRAGYLSKILVKVRKNNNKYVIVSNYSTDELLELGFTNKEIISMKKISIYDELMINPDLSKVE